MRKWTKKMVDKAENVSFLLSHAIPLLAVVLSKGEMELHITGNQ